MSCIRREMIKVQIGEKEYSEILITDADGGLIASITDKDIIEEKKLAGNKLNQQAAERIVLAPKTA